MSAHHAVEPMHTCTNKCTFVNSRQCKLTGNIHRCSQTCVVTDEENNYVCTVTGLVFSHLEDTTTCAYFDRKPSSSTMNVGRITGWIKEAIVAFLCDTPDRKALLSSAYKRSIVKIKRAMGSTPWCARSLAVTQAKIRRLSSFSLNVPLVECERFVDWLSYNLLKYYQRFAKAMFKATKSGIGTYTAVMISAMATGVKDSGDIWIIRKDSTISEHCPSPVDYPKLAPGMTTCKAISTGTFAIINNALSERGFARQQSLFRPTQCDL